MTYPDTDRAQHVNGSAPAPEVYNLLPKAREIALDLGRIPGVDYLTRTLTDDAPKASWLKEQLKWEYPHLPSDSRDISRDTRDISLWALIFFAALVAAITFILSFAGLDDYGRIVSDERRLSPLVPLGVDGITLVGVVATYKLRTAPLHVRIYGWLVFGVGLTASILGNLSHALAHHLSRQGQVGAAAWPVFLALASHVVIVVRRRQEMARTPASEVDTVTGTVAVDVAEKSSKPLDPQAYAVQMARRGWTAGRIQKALAERGETVHPRTVARWTEDVRKQKAADIQPTPSAQGRE